MSVMHYKEGVNVWVRNKNKFTLVAGSCRVFKRFGERFKGLIAEQVVKPSLFVLRKPTLPKLHCWGCCEAMDVVMLDENQTVLLTVQGFKPWTTLKGVKNVKYVLELPFGTIAGSGTRKGDFLQFYQTKKQKKDSA